ncbi:MAG: tetratricopeptide repeat protein [Planctomycetes bacterium]|nr:tetratricopeptide repeat protein [Planctomycetota bacterium]
MKLTASSPRRRTWTVNYRFAAAALAAAAAVVLGAAAWRSHQVHRLADALLREADDWERRRDWRRAADVLYRYSLLRPADRRAAVRRARAFDGAARGEAEQRQAAQLYQAAIQAAPDDASLHRRLAELLLEIGDFSGALVRAEVLLTLEPDDASAVRVKALALAEQFDRGGAVSRAIAASELQAAQRRNPEDVGLAFVTADFLRRHSLPSESGQRAAADALVDQAVARFPDRGDVLLSRHFYRARHQLPGAEADLTRAMEIAPHDPEVLLAAAARRADRGDWDAAARLYRDAIDRAPHDQRGPLGLGAVLFAAGRRDEAADVWRSALRRPGAGHNVATQLQLARALLCLGRLAEADDVLRSAETVLASEPSVSNAETARRRRWSLALRAGWHLAREELEPAAALLERQLQLYPSGRGAAAQDEHYGVLFQLGDVYQRLGRWSSAARSFQKAASLRSDAVAPRAGLAAAWESAGRWRLAAGAYREVMKLDPHDGNALCSIIGVLHRLAAAEPAPESESDPAAQRDACLSEALSWAKKAVAQRPEDAMAHLQLGQTLALLSRREEAEAAFLRAVEFGGGDHRVQLGRIAFYAQTGRMPLAQRTLEECAASAALTPGARAWFLAQGRRALGERAEAQRQYFEALRADPENVVLQQQVSDYFRGPDAARSRSLLRRALALSPASRSLQQSLAALESSARQEAQP